MAIARVALGYMLAVLAGTILVSIANTHVILQGLAAVGAEISAATRFDAISRDLVGFAPTLFFLVAIGFALALPVSALVYKMLGHGWRRFGYTLGGGVAVLVIMLAIKAYFGQVLEATATPIASARDWPGLITLALGGAGGGFLYALLTPGLKARD